MSTRLILLVVVAGVLAVGFAVRSSSPPPPESEQESMTPLDGDVGVSVTDYRLLQTPLDRRELPGSEPDVPPDFLINVSVDATNRKNRVFVDISEAHGYYVETFRLGLFYKPTPDAHIDDSPLRIEHFANQFLSANGTLHLCFDVVPAELNKVGGLLGSDDNWDAVIITYGRFRAANPDPLPRLASAYECD